MKRTFTEKRGHMRGHLPAFFLILFLLFSQLTAVGSETADTDIRRDTVMASILVASPGKMIYQAGGHAAIRLQCPAYGLDNVFSYETSSDRLVTQLLGQAKGRYAVLVLDEYLSTFREEGREVKAYPLNLTDPQIRLLWQLLDEDVAMGIEGDFNVRYVNCNSKTMEKVTQALGNDLIIMNEDHYSRMDNGTLQKSILKEGSPWSALVFNVGCGIEADSKDAWQTRMCPLIMPDYFMTAEIESPDGRRRQFVSGEPYTLLAGEAEAEHQFLTPLTMCMLLLIFSIVISLMDIMDKWNGLVFGSDVILLSMQTIGSIALIFMAVIPASIGPALNWMFIPLNILPVFVWTLFRRKVFCRWFFICYGIVCLLFMAAPLFTSEADIWSSLLSAAIAVRVLTHYLKTTIYKTI